MKFTLSREMLLRPLQHVCGVVERRQSLPILSNLLVEVTPEQVLFTATDLEMEIVATATHAGKTEAGKTTIPARKLLDICRSLGEESSIEISAQKDRVTVRAGKSRFTLATLPASDYPNIDSISEPARLSLPQKELKRLFDATQFAMAHQDVRYYLNGLMLELSEKRLRAVATDGHRLAYCEVALDTTVHETRQVIVPRKAVLEMARLLSDTDQPVQLQLGQNHIQLSIGDVTLASKLIDGRYPDYQNVLPKGGDKQVSADRQQLRQALSRAAVLSNEKYRSIRFQLTPDVLKLHANNPEQEEAEEEIAVDYQGQPLEVGFNANYLLDALGAIPEDRVELLLTDANSSCLIQAREGCKYVVMPMRL
jgi:DNA polymerase-3 subunit beta